MSYILDALKKSEQQRTHGSVPDVQTVHSSSLNYKNEKKALWPYILVIAVLLNFFVISYFIYDKSYSANDDKATSLPITATAKNTHTAPATAPSKEIESKQEVVIPVIKIEQEIQAEPVKDTSEAIAAVEENTFENSTEPVDNKYNANEIVDFYDLDDSLKRELPTITISAHVYSSNPLQRSIVINNNFMEEGEYLIDDLILIEITRNGAIFNYHGTQFHYNVVSGWQ